MPAYGKVKVDTITYDLSGTATDVSVANIATKASPTFTGTVTVPTPSANDNSTKAASTAYVQTELGDYLTTSTAASTYAPLASPTFTGSPTVPGYAALSGATFTGTVNGTSLVLSADLTVNGTTTTINTTTLQVEDKNIEIGKVSTPSDATADGGGLTLLGATNKTWNWVNSTDAWTSSEHIHLLDSKKLLLGTDSDLTVTHTGSAANIDNITGDLLIRQLGSSGDIYLDPKSGERGLKVIRDGAVELYFDNSKQLSTGASGVEIENGDLRVHLDLKVLNDNRKIYLGAGNDLSIWHDGSSSRIDNTTGALKFKTNTVYDFYNVDGTETVAKFTPNGSCELYHDNIKKIETTSSGCTVTGTLAATAVTGDGSGLTNLPPGGNTFTAVADGAIATNKLVKIKTNGKVEEIAQVLTDSGTIADNNSYEAASGSADAGSGSWLIYDPDQDRVVSFYTASYANNNMRYSVMSINSDGRANNGPISGSADLGVESTFKVNGNYEWGSVCYDTNNNKYILGVRCRNDNLLYVGAGTYDTSNDSITWPSGKSNWSQPNGTNNAGRIPTLYFDETTNRIVLLMRDDSNSDRPYVVIGTYNSSSGSIDWGTKQVLDTTDIRDNNTVVCKGGNGTGEVFVGYKSSTTALTGNLITVSNSSNTCTIQTAVTIQTNASEFRADYNAQDQNIILAYADTNDNYKGKLIRLTKNSGGTGFDKSSAYQFCANNQSSRWDVHYFSTSKKCYVFYRLSASNRAVKAFMVNNTSGTPSQTSTVSGSGGISLGDIWIGHTASSNQNVIRDKIFQAVPSYSHGNKVRIEGWAALSATNNIGTSTKHQYVGFADQAYSDGQTATIITYGNTKSGLSGLTIGSKYYVSASGSLSTTDGALGTAGVALAADKLLIKEPD